MVSGSPTAPLDGPEIEENGTPGIDVATAVEVGSAVAIAVAVGSGVSSGTGVAVGGRTVAVALTPVAVALATAG